MTLLVLVVMPDELAPHLHELHLLAVELGDDLGAEVLGDLGELLGEGDLVHGGLALGDTIDTAQYRAGCRPERSEGPRRGIARTDPRQDCSLRSG
jgi:hypothetical protein